MRYIIASDIHGSAHYCEKLLELYRKEKGERLILLGDLLYHGPRNDLPDGYAPKKVAAMLNELSDEIFCVRGNCEAEVDQMMLTFPVMADYALLPSGKSMIFITHGHLFNELSLPPLKSGDVLLHGHTHIPVCKTLDGGVTYVNPGSVSTPKENSAHSCILFENGVAHWLDLNGNEYMSAQLTGTDL